MSQQERDQIFGYFNGLITGLIVGFIIFLALS